MLNAANVTAAGQKDQALACYQEALALDPDGTQAYLGRASIYIEQGRFTGKADG
jgi:Tfp pilus assembly protein PilF